MLVYVAGYVTFPEFSEECSASIVYGWKNVEDLSV
jgi:hypothetical protein